MLIASQAKNEEQENVLLDEKLMTVPAVALQRCKVLATELGELACGALKNSLTLLDNYNDNNLVQMLYWYDEFLMSDIDMYFKVERFSNLPSLNQTVSLLLSLQV